MRSNLRVMTLLSRFQPDLKPDPPRRSQRHRTRLPCRPEWQSAYCRRVANGGTFANNEARANAGHGIEGYAVIDGGGNTAKSSHTLP